MIITRRALFAAVFAAAALFGRAASFAQATSAPAAGELTAIDILLDPDAVMVGRAQADNARLLADNPKGFALDAAHAPHITVIQRFVRTADLEKVYAAVASVSEDENPTAWKLQATGFYDIPTGNTGLAGIVVEPTADLLRLQQKLTDAVAPYTAENGTDAAFVARPDGGAMVAGLIDYVAEFVPKSSGKKYNPHVTIGVGTRAYLDKLKTEPFKSFEFKVRSVSVYQLGDYGTAQKLLWTSAAAAAPSSADPLPSWNDTPARAAILAFIRDTTTEGSPGFIPPEERIAVFDNDGTLWAEQPMYFQLAFAIDRVKALAPEHPEWKDKEPFRSILAGDLKSALAGGEHAIGELVMATHAGMTTDEFARIVADWAAAARHPRFNRLYTECIYQPMLEVLTLLRTAGFKTCIVSGGGVEFMRPWASRVYGIPPEQIIGSSGKTKFELRDGTPVLVKLPDIEFIDDKEGKPIAINNRIGRRPVAAFGNSDGDLAMLQWTAAGDPAHPGRPRLAVIIHHTDAAREWAYDRESSIGRLDKALDEAASRGFIVVDMKQDWKKVFAFE